ncbi:hypothetical protein [Spongiimicrobium salis]|uniref:hypothetical protein n=1 Tax=Spongiimicrobium salis TaxID=1667022 RepID=UPI00374D4213
MKQAINILLAYLTCDDPVMITKWENLLASFWHLDQGNIVRSIETDPDTGEIVIVTIDAADTETETRIAQYNEPESFPISKIQDLANQLSQKVEKTPGKGLSTEDFTQTLKLKLDNLQNYVHPAFHEIGEINGLLDIINGQNQQISILTSQLTDLGSQQFRIWNGYRLYKTSGGDQPYPETGDELHGRGAYRDGEYIIAEVLNDIPLLDVDNPANDQDLNEPIIQSL